jgi:hypothetical protein
MYSFMALLLINCLPLSQKKATSQESIPTDRQLKVIYTCETRDLATLRESTRSANNLDSACQGALDECFLKGGSGSDGPECVVKRWYDDQTTAYGQMAKRGWACQVSENLGPTLRGRTWIRSGKNQKEAQTRAMRYCSVQKAGNQCQIIKCFDTDNAQP